MSRGVPFSLRVACLALELSPLGAAQQQPAAPETFVLEGRVVDMRGVGVPAARVWVATRNDWDTEIVKAVADGEGCFRLGRVPRVPGLCARAKADGFCVGTQAVIGTPAVVTIDMQHAATVRGVLRDKNGKPAAGVVVRADPDARALSYVQSDARTDAEGRFELRDVPLGPIWFGAWIDGQGLFEVWQHVRGDCDVALAPTAASTTSFEITIEDLPATAPRVEFGLLPQRTGRLMLLPPPHDRPRADEHGKWSMDLVPDCECTVHPISSGFAFAPREQRVKAGSGPHRLVFRATPLGEQSLACDAIARCPDGQPVAGLPFVMRAPNDTSGAEATSAADGTLRFQSPLAAGAKVVVLTTDPRWVVDQPKNERRADARRALAWHETTFDPKTLLELRIIAACTVRGRVLLADQRPAAFAQVTLDEATANRMPRWMPMTSCTADRDGNFAFKGLHHLADEVRVCVDCRDGSFEGAPFHITEAGALVEAGDVRLLPPSAVEGVVVDGEQRPVGGVRVWLREWDLAANRPRSSRGMEVITDRQGRYRIVGATPGIACLELFADPAERSSSRRVVEPFEVDAGKVHTFDLQLSGK